MRYIKYIIIILFFSACKEPDIKKVSLDSDEAVKTACLLSQISYCSNQKQLTEHYLPGWKIVWSPVAVGGNYAYVATDGNIFAIAVRGTLLEFSWDAFQNWFYHDLDITSVEAWGYASNTEKAKIARGSFTGWRNICLLKDIKTGKTLKEFLEAETNTNTPILITGHSLGGNLASVYASYISQEFKNSKKERKNINVITFGAPAAGNKAFATDFDAKFPDALRFENNNDPAPKFPCSGEIAEMKNLFSTNPSATDITVGYKEYTVTLDKVFGMLNAVLVLNDLKNGGGYAQPKGKSISIPLSGNNINNTIEDWLNEAAYQHFIEQYATALDAPVVDCMISKNQ